MKSFYQHVNRWLEYLCDFDKADKLCFKNRKFLCHQASYSVTWLPWCQASECLFLATIHRPLTALYVIQIIVNSDSLYFSRYCMCLFPDCMTALPIRSSHLLVCLASRCYCSGGLHIKKNAVNAFSLHHNNRIWNTGTFVTALQFIIMNDPCFSNIVSFIGKVMMEIRAQLTWKWIKLMMSKWQFSLIMRLKACNYKNGTYYMIHLPHPHYVSTGFRKTSLFTQSCKKARSLWHWGGESFNWSLPSGLHSLFKVALVVPTCGLLI